LKEPRTTREALVAELLGDIDGLLRRAETMPDRLESVAARLISAAQALDDAGSRYRGVVNEFTGEATSQLTDYLQRKAAEIAAQPVIPPSSVDRPATSASADRTIRHGATPAGSLAARLLEHGLTAVLASMLTAALVLVIGR
jgi:hypothetical protein